MSLRWCLLCTHTTIQPSFMSVQDCEKNESDHTRDLAQSGIIDASVSMVPRNLCIEILVVHTNQPLEHP